MEATILPATAPESSVYINASFNGIKGKLHADEDYFIFSRNNEVDHAIPFRDIIKLDIIPSPSKDGTIEIKLINNIYSYSIDDDLTSVEELFYHLRGKTLSKKTIDDFFKEKTTVTTPAAKKMFSPEIIARVLDSKNLFHTNEKIKGALLGRYSPSFSEHVYGVLVATDQRVFFFSTNKIERGLENSEYKSIRVINSFEDFSDLNGRKSYCVEFNDSDFIVSVKTSRHIKIEMFYKSLEPNKVLNESF